MRDTVTRARRARSGTTVLAAMTLFGLILSLPAIAEGQTITICRPNGGESWTVGNPHAIHWNWTGSISSVKIEYSTDGGSTWSVITSSTTNGGDYLWSSVPNAPSGSSSIKVTSTANPAIYDVSDANFAIARPVITVTRPNGGTGGEIWTVGEKHAIHWDWTGEFSSVKLEYSSDGGSTWNVITSSTTNGGDYLWTVPNSPSITCRMKVTSTSDPSCFDISDHDFNIARPTITVIRPNGGETYYAGKHAPIHWNWSGNFSSVKIEYSTNGGSSWTVITSSTSNEGDYCWSVPSGVSSTTCKVRITNTSDANSYDVSDGNFTVSNSPPSDPLYLFSPRTGDAWFVGRDYYITWTWSGSISSVKLEYSTDGGSTWSLITSSTSNDGAYEWHIPNTPSTSCKLKISNTANPGVYDESDIFTIVKQWILTSSPRTGDAWLIGRCYYITWDWGGEFSSVKLECSTDGGSTWSLIISSTSNDGAYEWCVPDPPSTNSQIKITNVANPDVFDRTNIFVAAPQVITVTSPLTGDVWQAGRDYYVTWYWSGEFSSVKLEYSTDGGSTWSLIISSTSNDGAYEWRVPNAQSSNCKVKVTNTSNGAVYGVSGVFTILPQTGVTERQADPLSGRLAVEPNPSRGRAVLRYNLSEESDVELTVFDASGRQVRVLVAGRVQAGTYLVTWDGRGEFGQLLSSGVYFCRMEAGDYRTVNKLIVE